MEPIDSKLDLKINSHTWTEMKNFSHYPREYNEKNVANRLYSDDICIGWLISEGMTFT